MKISHKQYPAADHRRRSWYAQRKACYRVHLTSRIYLATFYGVIKGRRDKKSLQIYSALAFFQYLNDNLAAIWCLEQIRFREPHLNLSEERSSCHSK
jgi:hypothetical protein